MKLQIEIHLQSQLLWQLQLLLLLPLPVADALSGGGYLQQMQVKMIYCSIRLLHSQGSPNILDESVMIYAPARRQLVDCGLCLLDTDTHQFGQNWVTTRLLQHVACRTLLLHACLLDKRFSLRVQRSLKRLNAIKTINRSIPIVHWIVHCSGHHVLRLPNWARNCWSIDQLINWSIRRRTMACKLQRRGTLKAFTRNTHNVSQGYFCLELREQFESARHQQWPS